MLGGAEGARSVGRDAERDAPLEKDPLEVKKGKSLAV
jgi:hypothetical protein